MIFDTVDLHFLRQDREADLMQDPEIKRMALEKQKVEYDLIDQADETWVVSEFEKEGTERRVAGQIDRGCFEYCRCSGIGDAVFTAP